MVFGMIHKLTLSGQYCLPGIHIVTWPEDRLIRVDRGGAGSEDKRGVSGVCDARCAVMNLSINWTF